MIVVNCDVESVQTDETDMVKRDVEIETVGEGVDEIDKLAELIGEMQLKQEDQGCVHASNELQLHVRSLLLQVAA
ncbi:hypothetical protein Tco_0490154 [Tanacetum coccineum]